MVKIGMMYAMPGEIESLLAAGDDAALTAHIEAEMERTGYLTNASRSPAEIVRRLKEKLDPAGVLNPGRYVGGV